MNISQELIRVAQLLTGFFGVLFDGIANLAPAPIGLGPAP